MTKILAIAWLCLVLVVLGAMLYAAIVLAPWQIIGGIGVLVFMGLTIWAAGVVFPPEDNRYPPPGVRRGPLPPPPRKP